MWGASTGVEDGGDAYRAHLKATHGYTGKHGASMCGTKAGRHGKQPTVHDFMIGSQAVGMGEDAYRDGLLTQPFVDIAARYRPHQTA